MFEKLRRPGRSPKQGQLKKLFSFFVFGIICLVFVFLIPMGSKLAGEGVLAYVGQKPIRAKEFRIVEENIKQQYQSRLQQADEASSSKIQKEIRNRALNQLIDMYLIIQGAKQSGFRLSDKELREEIRSFPVFQQDGRFLYSRYLELLKNQNMRASRFENRVSKSQLVQNWYRLFSQAIKSNKLENDKKTLKYSYKVKLRVAELKTGEIVVEELEPLVKSKNLQKINQFLKKQKIKWEEQASFSPISPFGVPISKNKNLMAVLMHYLPSLGLIPNLIRQGDKLFLVNVLAFTEGTISKEQQQLESFISQRFDKSNRLIENWIVLQRQNFAVKISETF